MNTKRAQQTVGITAAEQAVLSFIAANAGDCHTTKFVGYHPPDGAVPILRRLIPRYVRLDPSGQLYVTMQGLSVLAGRAEQPEVHRIPAHDNRDVLNIWTIYFNPVDAPGKYVLRRFEVHEGQSVPCERYVADDIQLFRTEMRRRGLVMMNRDPNDHETVVECWL